MGYVYSSERAKKYICNNERKTVIFLAVHKPSLRQMRNSPLFMHC